MGIQSFAGSSVSTEGIVTVKITAERTATTLPVPLPAGNYRIDTGFSGTLWIIIKDGSGSTLADFSFATTSFFTISGVGTTIQVLSPSAAINGIVTVNLLKRGVVSSEFNTWKRITLNASYNTNMCSLVATNNKLYVVGGSSSTSWSEQAGTSGIQVWDKNISTPTTTMAYTPGTNLAGNNQACKIGTAIYFNRGNNGAAFFRFETTTNTLTEMASRPTLAAIDNLVPSSDGTKIFSFGSYSGTNAIYSYVYTVSTNSWARIADLPMGSGHGTHDFSGSDANHIYIYAKEGINNLYRYNISTNTYTDMGFAHGVSGSYNSRGARTIDGARYINAQPDTGSAPRNYTFWSIKTDGTAPASLVTTPGSVLTQNVDVTGTGLGDGGYAMAFDSDYVYWHGKNSPYVWYKSYSDFVTGLV